MQHFKTEQRSFISHRNVCDRVSRAEDSWLSVKERYFSACNEARECWCPQGVVHRTHDECVEHPMKDSSPVGVTKRALTIVRIIRGTW